MSTLPAWIVAALPLGHCPQHAGGTTSGFLSELYHDLLGRPIESAGHIDGSGLATEQSRAALALFVANSTEAEQDCVTGYYEQLLLRAPDVAGQNYWMARLLLGQRDGAVQAAILASDELFRNL